MNVEVVMPNAYEANQANCRMKSISAKFLLLPKTWMIVLETARAQPIQNASDDVASNDNPPTNVTIEMVHIIVAGKKPRMLRLNLYGAFIVLPF